MKDVVAVLSNFKELRADGRSRSDYMDVRKATLAKFSECLFLRRPCAAALSGWLSGAAAAPVSRLLGTVMRVSGACRGVTRSLRRSLISEP